MATFSASPSAGPTALQADATVMARRLHDLGSRDTVSVVGHVLQIQGAKLPVPAADLAETGRLAFRPALCGAPAYTGGTGTPPSAVLPPCRAKSQLTAANLRVNPATDTPSRTPPPDPQFASIASTPPGQNSPTATVLLTVQQPYRLYPRMVLGPAQFGNTDVASVVAEHPQGTSWMLVVTMTQRGAAHFNALARQTFHAMMAIDMDGMIQSAPLIQPSQTSFTPFGDKIDISGTFSATKAKALAAVLASGPLEVPLTTP